MQQQRQEDTTTADPESQANEADSTAWTGTIHWAIRELRLAPGPKFCERTAKAHLAAIASHGDYSDGGGIFLAIATIAADVGCHPRTSCRYVNELERRGLIARSAPGMQFDGRRSQYASCSYRVTIGAPLRLVGTATPKGHVRPGKHAGLRRFGFGRAYSALRQRRYNDYRIGSLDKSVADALARLLVRAEQKVNAAPDDYLVSRELIGQVVAARYFAEVGSDGKLGESHHVVSWIGSYLDRIEHDLQASIRIEAAQRRRRKALHPRVERDPPGEPAPVSGKAALDAWLAAQ